MANYVEVGDVEQLPPGRGTVVKVEGKDVALFNVDGTFYAIEDACLHQGCRSELRSWRARSSPVEVTDGNMT
jgi:nitrite reductase/ring-hydroxylating ferredoxin subunit